MFKKWSPLNENYSSLLSSMIKHEENLLKHNGLPLRKENSLTIFNSYVCFLGGQSLNQTINYPESALWPEDCERHD